MKATLLTGRGAHLGRLVVFLIGAAFLLNGLRDTTLVDAQSGEEIGSSTTSSHSVAPEGGITSTFSNTSPVVIPDSGPGSPYPSVITVSNIPTQLAKVTVRLNNFSHSFGSDVDMLLVGPQGQTAVILSDVGGSVPVAGATITLDDAAASALPTGTALLTGTFRPTNAQIPDNFPAPAPASPSTSAALSVFQGTNPNGQWRLFIVDDAGIDSGNLAGGWTLTFTAAISGQNTNTVTIPDSGMAAPYPSEIVITDHPNPISKVQVNLNGFTHTSPDDVDILVQSPSGRTVLLMSDVGGGNAVSNLFLSFEDVTANSLPDNAPLTSGTFKPTDYEPGDSFPAPAPAGATARQTLSALNGTVANGTWKLFVVDDAGNNVGSLVEGWSIFLSTSTGVFTFEGTATASPYPATITISGLPGAITRATVSISNLSHTSPDDVDMLLVGPDGRKIVLMSDAGGTSEVGGVYMTFDDAAPSPVLDNGPLLTGAYKPADWEPGEVFPAPAPAGPPTGTGMGAFYGGLPNGVWKLYIVGDGASSFGTIVEGWAISLQTSTTACLFSVSPTVQAFPISGGSGSFNVTQPNGCGWTASTTDPFLTVTSGSAGAGNGTVGFTVAANEGPARTGTIDVTNGLNTRSFQIQQPSGCPTSLSATTVNFGAAGGPGSVTITAGTPCGWQGMTVASWIQITSGPQTGNGTLTFNVAPNNTGAARSGTIEVGSMSITVNQSTPRAARFDFDGDAKSDVSVFRPSTGTWWILPSGQPAAASAQQFGVSTDRIVPADFDGDDKTDIGVYRDGAWYVLKSSDGTVLINNWGTATDTPVPGDYDGDGNAQFAVFRPSNGSWWIVNSNGSFASIPFGIVGDIPTPGDFDGDGKTDLSVYRPATSAGAQGAWWVLNSSDGTAVMQEFGVQGDIPVPADYDGDGRDNVSVFRPSTGVWYRSPNRLANYDAVQWGISSDRPAPGDYDGDGRADPAVFRFGGGAVWYILGSTSGPQGMAFGTTGDKPAPSAFIQ